MNKPARTKTAWLALCAAACLAWPAAVWAASLDEGIAQYRAENFEEALVLLESARRDQPDSSLAAFYLGLARKQSGDLSGAIRELEAAVRLSPPVVDAYLELADALHQSGRNDEAQTWLQRAEQSGVRPGQVAFLKGMILMDRGNRKEALAAFTQAKAADKSLTQAADFQIAIAMAGERKLGGARDALRALIAADPTSEIASYAKEYEQSFTRLIESYRPLRLTVGLNYLYDDNAISNPSDADARAQIGNPTGQRDHAFLGTLRLDYNPMLSGDNIFSAQYLLHSTKYGNTDTSDENPSTLINSLTLIPGHSFGDSMISLPVNYTHVLLKERPYQETVTVRPTWSWQLAPQHILQTAFSYTRREMLISPLASDENRDADIFGGSAGYIFTYGAHGGLAGLRYDYNLEDTRGTNWANEAHRISANAVIPLVPTVRLNLSCDFTLQEYLNHSTSFRDSSQNGIKRNDKIWVGSAGLSWNITPDVVVSAQYAHTTADSTISFYGYERNTLTAGIELSF